MTTNFLYWILYYLKCGFNICYSYILNIINFNSNINTVNALENYSKLNENLYLIKPAKLCSRLHLPINLCRGLLDFEFAKIGLRPHF